MLIAQDVNNDISKDFLISVKPQPRLPSVKLLTPNIQMLILLTDCHALIVMSVMGIWLYISVDKKNLL